MNHTIVSTFSILSIFTLAGCGGGVDVVTSTEHPGSEAQGAPVSNDSVTTHADTLSITGAVHEADGSALPGVSVCLQAGPTIAMDIAQCSTSGEDGSFALHDMPQNEMLTIAMKKPGFAPIIRAIQTDTTDVEIPADENRMIPEKDAGTFMGSPTDPSLGGIEFFVSSEGADAAHATVRLTSVDGQNHEPVYFGADGNPDMTATAGTWGAFSKLPAGLYMLTFSNAACTAKSGLYGYPIAPFEGANMTTIVVPVVEGHVTTPVGVDCTSSSAPVAH